MHAEKARPSGPRPRPREVSLSYSVSCSSGPDCDSWVTSLAPRDAEWQRRRASPGGEGWRGAGARRAPGLRWAGPAPAAAWGSGGVFAPCPSPCTRILAGIKLRGFCKPKSGYDGVLTAWKWLGLRLLLGRAWDGSFLGSCPAPSRSLLRHVPAPLPSAPDTALPSLASLPPSFVQIIGGASLRSGQGPRACVPRWGRRFSGLLLDHGRRLGGPGRAGSSPGPHRPHTPRSSGLRGAQAECNVEPGGIRTSCQLLNTLGPRFPCL